MHRKDMKGVSLTAHSKLASTRTNRRSVTMFLNPCVPRKATTINFFALSTATKPLVSVMALLPLSLRPHGVSHHSKLVWQPDRVDLPCELQKSLHTICNDLVAITASRTADRDAVRAIVVVVWTVCCRCELRKEREVGQSRAIDIWRYRQLCTLDDWQYTCP